MFGRLLFVFLLTTAPVLGQRIIPTQPYAPGNNCRPAPAPRSLSEQSKWEEWPGYRAQIASLEPLLSNEPDSFVWMPVRNIRVRQIAGTFGALRTEGRKHEGQDIFAKRGTPVFSATAGVVLRMANGPLGGLQIYILGTGGRRYYYAHLDRFAPDLSEGDWVTPQTLLGFVGNTGIARTTPPHLHFGIYMGARETCDYRALDPLPLLRNRNWNDPILRVASSR